MTVEVTKADRDAAAPIFRLYGAENYAVLCEKGSPHVDLLAVVQAFAQHRLSSLEGVAGLVEAAKQMRDFRADLKAAFDRAEIALAAAPQKGEG